MKVKHTLRLKIKSQKAAQISSVLLERDCSEEENIEGKVSSLQEFFHFLRLDTVPAPVKDAAFIQKSFFSPPQWCC